jgi:hypothetical protein
MHLRWGVGSKRRRRCVDGLAQKVFMALVPFGQGIMSWEERSEYCSSSRADVLALALLSI